MLLKEDQMLKIIGEGVKFFNNIFESIGKFSKWLKNRRFFKNVEKADSNIDSHNARGINKWLRNLREKAKRKERQL